MSVAQLNELATLPTEFNNVTGGATDINASFVLSSGYFVFFMHCGFAMLSVGCVRAKFAKHIAMLILVDACASGFGWYFFGYAFAFGDRVNADGVNINNGFIGTRQFAFHKLPTSEYHLWFFQWTFAATSCTIVSGALAERAKFEAYILYAFFMAAWVYPVVVHASWSSSSYLGMFRTNGKLLFDSGSIDFAGSGVVHITGGIAAAVGCAILGPRLGRFRDNGIIADFTGHNYSLFILGVMILWFGWYGFNPGSNLAILPLGNSLPVQVAAVSTTLSPCAAGITGFMIKYFYTKLRYGIRNYDMMTFGNSVLAGLVAITSSCSTVYPWAAIVIGIVAGFMFNIGSEVSLWMHLDDPLDAIAVHAWNGVWGLIAPGLFSAQDLIRVAYGVRTDNGEPRTHYGCFMTGGTGNLLAAQLVTGLFIICWTAINMGSFFGLLRFIGLFRVDASAEEVGLDKTYHGGDAYTTTTNRQHKTMYSQDEIGALRDEFEEFKASFGPQHSYDKRDDDVIAHNSYDDVQPHGVHTSHRDDDVITHDSYHDALPPYFV